MNLFRFPIISIAALLPFTAFLLAENDSSIMDAVFDGQKEKDNTPPLVFSQKKEKHLVLSSSSHDTNISKKNNREKATGDIGVSNGKVLTHFPVIKGGKELDNKTIDKIFISISKELEKERARKKKQEEEARLKKIAEEKARKLALSLVRNTPPKPVPALSKKALDAANAAMNPGLSAPKDKNNSKALFSAVPLKIKFYGTICNTKGCVVLSSDGILKKGSKIEESGEMIRRITRTHIITNIRKIKI